MDYKTYKTIQADLGSLGDGIRSEIKTLTEKSSADNKSKELVLEACNKISDTIDALCIIVSKIAASAKTDN